MSLRPLLGSALIVLAVALPAAAQTAPHPFVGQYANADVRLRLASDDGRRYTGEIVRAGSSYALTATHAGRRLTGSFDAAGQTFDFTVDPGDDGEVVLKSGQSTYRLKKSAGGERDPLAYRILKLPGGTIAQFDDWVYAPPRAANNVLWCDGAPRGREREFVLRAAIATPNAADQANLFDAGPRLVEQALAGLFGPVFKRTEPGKRVTCGGDDAMVEQYAGRIDDKDYTCRVMYVKRADVAVAVMAVGTNDAFNEFGRSVEIVAQSITLKESALDAGLLGTWVAEHHVIPPKTGGKADEERINVAMSRSITIFPNGTFVDTAQSGFSGRDVTGLAQGGHRGKVIKRGQSLTFHYDNGTTWTAGFELFRNGLKLDGKIYLKQCRP